MTLRDHGAPARGFAPAGAPIRVDDPRRSSGFPRQPLTPIYLAIDRDGDLPLVAFDGFGKEQARFRHLADMAWFIGDGEPPSLPLDFVTEARREGPQQLDLLAGK